MSHDTPRKFIHWLGGPSVTPACGAWAFSDGERTDLFERKDVPSSWTIPKRTIGCTECLRLLKMRKNRDHYFVYRNRRRLIREMKIAARKTVRHAKGWLRQFPASSIPDILREPIKKAIEDADRSAA